MILSLRRFQKLVLKWKLDLIWPLMWTGPGPLRPRCKARTLNPGFGKFYIHSCSLYYFIGNLVLILAFELAAQTVYEVSADDLAERGRKLEHQQALQEVRSNAKKLSAGNHGFFIVFLKLKWISCWRLYFLFTGFVNLSYFSYLF